MLKDEAMNRDSASRLRTGDKHPHMEEILHNRMWHVHECDLKMSSWVVIVEGKSAIGSAVAW